MDDINQAIINAFREYPRAFRAARRYGLASFRQRVRQHVEAGELRIVRMYEEPKDVRRAMVAVSLALDTLNEGAA